MPVPIIELPNDWDVNELSAREKTIRNFAYTVFGLIAVITITILGDWFWRAPIPNVSADKTALDNIQALNALAMSRAKDMFDLMIVKALLPVFATVIGVLLGRRISSDSE